jgi:hypothetical protein
MKVKLLICVLTEILLINGHVKAIQAEVEKDCEMPEGNILKTCESIIMSQTGKKMETCILTAACKSDKGALVQNKITFSATAPDEPLSSYNNHDGKLVKA